MFEPKSSSKLLLAEQSPRQDYRVEDLGLLLLLPVMRSAEAIDDVHSKAELALLDSVSIGDLNNTTPFLEYLPASTDIITPTIGFSRIVLFHLQSVCHALAQSLAS